MDLESAIKHAIIIIRWLPLLKVQCAYQPGIPTETVLHYAEHASKTKELCAAALLDIKQAFKPQKIIEINSEYILLQYFKFIIIKLIIKCTHSLCAIGYDLL